MTLNDPYNNVFYFYSLKYKDDKTPYFFSPMYKTKGQCKLQALKFRENSNTACILLHTVSIQQEELEVLYY